MSYSLCQICQHCKEVVSGKGSRFLLCQRALHEPNYLKYPPQPVVRCRGYAEREGTGAD